MALASVVTIIFAFSFLYWVIDRKAVHIKYINIKVL